MVRPQPKVLLCEQFTNGVPFSPILKAIFLSFASREAQARWPRPVESIGENSFYAWLCAPAEDDPWAPAATPQITNLALAIHRGRSDLTAAFPYPFGQHRIDYAFWFVDNVYQEYQLAPVFIEPIQQSFARWGNQNDWQDPAAWQARHVQRITCVPILTNLATYLHTRRPDLQQAFPDRYGVDRIAYICWFVSNAGQEHRFSTDVIQTLQERLQRWSTTPDPAHRHAAESFPLMSTLTPHASERDSSFQKRFADPYMYNWLASLVCFVLRASQQRYASAEAYRALVQAWWQGWLRREQYHTIVFRALLLWRAVRTRWLRKNAR